MLCAIRHPETFKLQSLLVDTDRMCGSLKLRLRRVARGRLSRKSWTDDERNAQNGPGFEADEQVSPGASFAGQELAQGLCAQNLSPDRLRLAGEVQDHLNPKPAIINTHYAHGRGWMGTFSMLDQMYDRNRMLGADEMSEVPHEMTPTDGRVEAWEFMVGGGSVYNGLINGNRRSASWDKVEAHAYRRYLGYLKTFLASFDFVRMRQDKRVIHGGLPAGAFARVISELGKQYALYLHHSARMDTHYIVRPGTYQARLLLALPAGSYHAAWVLPESGAVVKMESFRHAGGNRMLRAPRYTIDIALRIKATTHS